MPNGHFSKSHLKKLATEVEKAFEYCFWTVKVPWLRFPPYMEVAAIPPYSGAVVRFLVRHRDKPDAIVLVYLDCYDVLGDVGEPYWLVSSCFENDGAVVPMEDGAELVRVIDEKLRAQK